MRRRGARPRPGAAFALSLWSVGLAAADARAGGPEQDYVLHCQGCHRPDGGATPGSVPALAGQVARFLHVPGGRDFLARVPGVAQASLGDGDLARLLNWMVSRFDAAHVPPDFAPYEAVEVGALRRQPLVDVSEARRRLVAAMERPAPPPPP